MKTQNSIILFIIFLFSFVSCQKEPTIELDLQPEDQVLDKNCEYIAVLGDIQEYTGDATKYPFLDKTMNWLWSQQQYGKKFNSILQVGDITSNNTTSNWKRFYGSTISTAEEVLYVACIGNHDYTWDDRERINGRNSTQINSYAAFPLTVSKVVSYFESGKIENIIVSNEIFGERYDIVVLEFGARKEVLKWANDYISCHPERKFILMTHEFLTGKGLRISSNSAAEVQFFNTTWSSPEDVWQKLIKDNDNIVCVLCGHNGFSAQLYSTNTAGRDVPQILFNLQYQENGGDGWIQLWEFSEQSDSVNVFVYNTIRREIHSNPATSFKFRYRY